MKVLITTAPFGNIDRTPVNRLENENIQYLINPLGRKLSEAELVEMVKDFDVIIAGTEPISELVMKNATQLKLISRVGIGLDNVDLIAAKKFGIKVTYTPDAPSPAVAELTIGLIISLMRQIHKSNSQMHNGNWYRHFGKRIETSTIGILGVGRIGSRLVHLLSNFHPKMILLNDINPTKDFDNIDNVKWVSKEKIYQDADVITLHTPLTKQTKNLISFKQLKMMKKDAILLNTARGGIINEKDLYSIMKSDHLFGAAIDVFETEPYDGPLREIERCLLTSHMGSMSEDCRIKMEIEATNEAINFLHGKQLINPVPVDEFKNQL